MARVPSERRPSLARDSSSIERVPAPDAELAARLALLEGARDEDGVDGVDHAVRALDVSRPVRRLRRALRLEADDRVIEPRLAREAAVEELAAEALLVARDRALRDLALDDVVLEDVSRERRAVVLLVLLERRVRRREERELAARERVLQAHRVDRRAELAEVVVALDVRLLVAELDALRAPEDLRALELGELLRDRAGHRDRRRADRGAGADDERLLGGEEREHFV